jgi:Raf kinase inhibitor-like YbhB/YbcL family protein
MEVYMKRGAFVLAMTIAAAGAQAQSFKLTSSELTEGGRLAASQVLNGFGCQGPNRSPHLAWDGAPEGTKSFVVTLYDPDAPTGSGWWHWVVFNLPASTRSLASGAGDDKGTGLPAGAVQGRTDFGKPGFGGACPPEGRTHRYIFTVHALKVEKLDLPADSSAALIGFVTNANALGRASLTVNFSR